MSQKDRQDIVANLRLYSTAEGGRLGPVIAERVFKCVFVFRGEYFDCGLLMSGIDPIHPGQHVKVPIQFLVRELLDGRLAQGDKFQLWEGKTIADGEIESVFLEGKLKSREPNVLDEE